MIYAGADALLDYFVATYVNGPPNRGPVFRPLIWNVHALTLIDGPRTNNECEGWNNR